MPSRISQLPYVCVQEWGERSAWSSESGNGLRAPSGSVDQCPPWPCELEPCDGGHTGGTAARCHFAEPQRGGLCELQQRVSWDRRGRGTAIPSLPRQFVGPARPALVVSVECAEKHSLSFRHVHARPRS